MKRRIRLKTLNQFNKLKNGTILIQVYHHLSKDDSRFDINQKIGDNIKLLEVVGNREPYINDIGKKSSIEFIVANMNENKHIYVAEKWLQELYK